MAAATGPSGHHRLAVGPEYRGQFGSRGQLPPPMPRLEAPVDGNIDVVAVASLIEAELNVRLVGDVAHGDRPYVGDALDKAKAVRRSQQPEPMRVVGSIAEVNR